MINRFKEIALELEDEFKDLSPEDQLETELTKVSAMAVPSLFQKNPLSPYAKERTDENNKMRPHRPWVYDHIIAGTERRCSPRRAPQRSELLAELIEAARTPGPSDA